MGIIYIMGGFLVEAASTGKYIFDIYNNNWFFCGCDMGWITEYIYIVYTLLLLSITIVIFKGTPTYPTYSGYWDIIKALKVSQFYMAPTALRVLKRAGSKHIPENALRHLHVLSSVGKPIAPEVWKWYFEVVGKKESHIVNISNYRNKVAPI